MPHESIQSAYNECINGFILLLRSLANRPTDAEASDEQLSARAMLEDQRGRFRVWAMNLGAHRADSLSLDYKLREAPHIRQKVLDLLEELNTDLQQAQETASCLGQKPSDEEVSDSDSSESLDGSIVEMLREAAASATPVSELCQDIKHIVDCLYKFTISIRNPAPRDKLEKLRDPSTNASTKVSHFEFFDIQHVRNLYPNLHPKTPKENNGSWLSERLGRANTRRRQLLAYNKRHAQKIAAQSESTVVEEREKTIEHSAMKAIVDKPSDNRSLVLINDQVASRTSAPPTIFSRTTASTYKEGAAQVPVVDTGSDSGRSQTSYAPSINDDTETKVDVPQPPNVDDTLDGLPFICPYCQEAITLRYGMESWRKHVFKDLRPYVCTFRDCNESETLYVNRAHWYEHEVEVHRREWFCHQCDDHFPTPRKYEDHIKERHEDARMYLSQLIDRNEIASESDAVCPICMDGKTYSQRRLRSHIGRHMQRIALFVLHRHDCDLDAKVKDEFESIEAELSQGSLSEDDDSKDHSFSDAPYRTSTSGSDDTYLRQNSDILIDEASYTEALDIPGEATTTDELEQHNPIDQFIKDGGDLNTAAYENGKTWLHLAAETNELFAVRQLLDHGADIDSRDNEQFTPLHRAAMNGHTKVVRTLLLHGADLESKNKDGQTPLLLASWRGKERVVELLLGQGADPNVQDRQGRVPLFRAVSENHIGVSNRLISGGAHIHERDHQGRTVLHAAAMGARKDIIELLLMRGADLAATDKEGLIPLHFARQNKNADAVNLLHIESVAMHSGNTAQIAEELMIICKKYTLDVVYAEPEIKVLTKKVAEVHDVLKKVDIIVRGKGMSQVHTLDEPIEQCKSIFSSLLNVLKSAPKKKLERGELEFQFLEWPFTSEVMENGIGVLEKHKTTISRALGLKTNIMLDVVAQDHLISKLPNADLAAFTSRLWEHSPRCLPGTRLKLLEMINAWGKDVDGASIYLLTGMAGTGKSTIARTIAADFALQRCLGASFFFSRKVPDLSHAGKFVSSIAIQLMNALPFLRLPVCRSIERTPDICQKSLAEQWEILIRQPLEDIKGDQDVTELPLFIIVVDALDECDNADDIRPIISLLSQVKMINSVRLRIFVTARSDFIFRLASKAEVMQFILHDIPMPIIDHDISTFFSHNLQKVRISNELPEGWPGDENINRLCERTHRLFIYAETACRFISGHPGGPQKALSLILQDQYIGQSHGLVLDSLYTDILRSSVIHENRLTYEGEDGALEFRQIIGPVISLFEPLSSNSLEQFLSLPGGTVYENLNSISSVLHIPNSPTEPIRLLHPSFRDFLLDRERCVDPRFWLDRKSIHRTLVVSSLELMSKHLRMDICDLRLFGTLTNEVRKSNIEACLPASIQYACLHWVDHLEQSSLGYGLADDSMVHVFLKSYFLHWLEALSLIRKISAAFHSIRRLEVMVATTVSELMLSGSIDYEAQ